MTDPALLSTHALASVVLLHSLAVAQPCVAFSVQHTCGQSLNWSLPIGTKGRLSHSPSDTGRVSSWRGSCR